MCGKLVTTPRSRSAPSCTRRAQRSSPPLLEQLGDRVEISSEPKGSSAEKLTAAFATSTEEGEDPLVGTFVGAFKIRERLGEGGFGVVYCAEQSEPVRRKVALKIIKPGMDSKEVLARFEAERQALAMMDHPHIAKVLEAGTDTSGRPFFVMELVKGTPITEFVRREKLSIADRLRLMTSGLPRGRACPPEGDHSP